MKTYVQFTECEMDGDTMKKRCTCFINKNKVEYIEEVEDHKGYSFIGLDRITTIVKGTPNQIIKKLEGK